MHRKFLDVRRKVFLTAKMSGETDTQSSTAVSSLRRFPLGNSAQVKVSSGLCHRKASQDESR